MSNHLPALARLAQQVGTAVGAYQGAVRSVQARMTQWGSRGWSISGGLSPSSNEGTGRQLRVVGFERNPVVAACIRAVADIPGGVPLRAMHEDADGELDELGPRHPYQHLLDNPRFGMSSHRHRFLKAAHYIGYGNAYEVIERKGAHGPPTGLRLIHPEWIQYVYLHAETQEPVLYQWTDRAGVVQKTPWQDMVHSRDLTLGDWIFGFPRGAAALLDILTDGEASDYVRQVLVNNGSPGDVVLLSDVVDGTTAEQLEARWHEKMVDRGQRGRTVFLGGATKLERVGFNLSDLEFPSLRQVAREDICAAFGVDPRMVGIASAKGNEGGLSGVQYAEARKRLYLQTGFPMMLAIESELDLSLAPEFGADVRTRFDADAIAEITEDMVATSTRVGAEFQAGLRSLEESRAAVGLPEQIDPSHHVVSSMFGSLRLWGVQVELAKKPPVTPLPLGPGDDTQPPAGTAPTATPADGTTDDAEQRQLPSLTGAARRVLPSARTIRRGTVLTAEQLEAIRAYADQRATSEEGTYRRAALLLFHAERDMVQRVFALAERHAPAPFAMLDTDDVAAALARRDDEPLDAVLAELVKQYGPNGDARLAWQQRFEPLYRETFSKAGSTLAGQLGIDWSLENPRITDAIRTRAVQLATYVGETTATEILAIVQAGRTAGLGAREIGKLIDQQVFENQAPARAERIARTETIGAMNRAEYETATMSGVVRSKRWLSVMDGKERDTHNACHSAGAIPLAQPFAPNGMMHPHDPAGPASEVVNCRCSLLYSDEE